MSNDDPLIGCREPVPVTINNEMVKVGCGKARPCPDHEAVQGAVGVVGRKRTHLLVTIEQDAVPGWGNQATDHQEYLQGILSQMLAHYHPTVEIVPDDAFQPLEGAAVTDVNYDVAVTLTVNVGVTTDLDPDSDEFREVALDAAEEWMHSVSTPFEGAAVEVTGSEDAQ